jgi:hypothetical protein
MASEGKRLLPIENRLRGDLNRWAGLLSEVAGGSETIASTHQQLSPDAAASWASRLRRAIQEMNQANLDLTVLQQDLAVAKTEAEYREVLVRAWPTNHFLDRLSYLGGALLGAGGAAYILEGFPVAVVFWTTGLILMTSGLYGLRKWEQKKWEFYADQFSVEPKYRP